MVTVCSQVTKFRRYIYLDLHYNSVSENRISVQMGLLLNKRTEITNVYKL